MLNFLNITPEVLQLNSELVGCRFLPSIEDIGFRRANTFVKEWRTLPQVEQQRLTCDAVCNFLTQVHAS